MKILIVNCELIIESEHQQPSSNAIRKNVQIGREEKNCKVSENHHLNNLKFGFIQERDSELDPRAVFYRFLEFI